MIENIPMSSADLDESDVQAVLDVVRSGRLALGPKTIEFERMIAEYVGTRHAVAVNSGTAALHLIVKALGIGQNDEVLVPSFTFAASVNAFLYEGATPVFVDIEPDTYNLDAADLERKITPRTKAVMAVDVFGHPAEWDEILRVAAKHDLKVIDDSCEALGAEYKGRKLGQFGDAGAFAFYPNKQMTTGEGGIIVCDDEKMANLCRSLRNQGRDGGLARTREARL
jgi:perosamine synthetase